MFLQSSASKQVVKNGRRNDSKTKTKNNRRPWFFADARKLPWGGEKGGGCID